MEEVVGTIKVFCQDKNWKELKNYVSESAGSIILKHVSKIDSAISAFDPDSHCFGYVNMIYYKLTLPNFGDFELFFNQIQVLAERGQKEQILQCLDKFFHIMHVFSKAMIEQNQAIRGIKVLMNAIDISQNTPTELIPLHADLLQLCLRAKCLRPALKYLETDIDAIGPEMNEASCKPFLLYYYYGGLIYSALKQYEKAFFYFQIVIATPASSCSHIMLEAAKKYTLISLLLHGKIAPVPKYTSPVIQRYFKSMSGPYAELVDAYVKQDISAMRNVMEKHQAVFVQDKNFGLVKQVATSITKMKIQKLTKTFLTLSLADTASRVNLSDESEAEKYLLQMIEEGKIFAKIDEEARMLSFHNNPDINNTSFMMEHVQSQMRTCMDLNEKLQSMDRNLQVNPHYVQKVVSMGQGDDPVKGDELLG